MTHLIKQFIEKHITLIEQKEYDLLYEEAYRIFTNSFCAELTAILTEVFNEDFNSIAKSIAYLQFEENLQQFLKDNNSFMSLPSFISLYMGNNLCGVDFYEFKDFIIANPPQNPNVKFHIDAEGEVYIERIR